MKKPQHIPKGSYHAFCRQYYHVQQSQPIPNQTYYQNNRKGQPKTIKSQRNNKINQFNTFEDYLTNLNNQSHQINLKSQNHHHTTKHISKSVHVQPKSIQTERKYQHKHSLIRQNKTNQQQRFNQKQNQFSTQRQTKKKQKHSKQSKRLKYQQDQRQRLKLTGKQTQRQTQRKLRAKSQRDSTKRLSDRNRDELVGAFLPYFKVKLQLSGRENKGVVCKMDDKKFRLNELLVQQNKVVYKWFNGI